ncbi:MAG: hypothetical protein ABSH22_00195 [Tepidisphaeraceae bacterium]
MVISGQTLPAALSGTVLAVLAVMLAASVAVFSLLARQIARKHQESVIRQWARLHGGHLIESPWRGEPPLPLKRLEAFHPRASITIVGPNWALAELTTDSPPEAQGNVPRWRIMAMQSDLLESCPPTGLRPVSHAVSFVDLFSLSSFPSLSAPEQFVLFGCEAAFASAFASVFAELPARNLLRSDVGVLVCGRAIWLDFSSRLMSTEEFERMLQLGRQLLPAVEQMRLVQKSSQR